jgi:hypothetical protein
MRSLRELSRNPGRAAQAGFAAILLLVILVLGSLYALLSGVNTATAELQQKRGDATTAALKQAKEALIAWSALTATQGPGHLPCPDRDNDGAGEGAACGTPATRIGRLPWRTLGLPDLRDASGERLWYVVSANFVNQVGNPVNSDTQGQLTVTGLSPASNVIAIVFSAGPALAGQNRGGPDTGFGVPKTTVANYLENANADATDDVFVSSRRCEQAAPACPLGPFNDELATMTHQELLDAVENVVAKRIETEVVPMLRYLRDRWATVTGPPGFFPFAAPFDPGQAATGFCGVDGSGRGLLPVSQCLVYDEADVSDTGTGDGSLDSWSCGPTPAGEPDALRMIAATCRITYTRGVSGTPNVRVFVEIDRAVRTLAVPVEASLIAFGNTDTTYTGGTPWGAITSQALDSDGDLEITYRGNLPDLGAGTHTVSVTIPVYSARTRYQQTTGVDTGWFFDNDWYRLTYYSVVSQRLFAGSGSSTFTVLTYPGTTNSKDALYPPPAGVLNNADKEALLVLAGRAGAGVVRPSTSLAPYLEGENQSIDDVFEQRARSGAPWFNDKLVVVAP